MNANGSERRLIAWRLSAIMSVDILSTVTSFPELTAVRGMDVSSMHGDETSPPPIFQTGSKANS